ncbi:MAG: MBL fold metallo-hydrolase [Nocardioidaceae bacterium]
MQLTKFAHSCVTLSEGDRTLVIDPGVFSEAARALDGADGVLITHEHPDHVDAAALTAAVEADPNLRVWAPESVLRVVPELRDVVTVVGAGEDLDAAGFGIRTFGGQHALIHSSVPVVANVGFLVNDTVYHPGDSFTVPPTPVDTALVPVHAPWSAVGEVLDFEIAVRARRAYQIHDGLLNDNGFGVVYGHVRRIAGEYGTDFRVLDSGETVEL